MNLLGLQAEIGRLLNDPNHERWSASILTTRINLSQIEIQGYTNAVKTVQNLTPVAEVSSVSLDADTMDIIEVTKELSNGSIRPLNGITIQELNFQYPDWRQWESGEPLFWYYQASGQLLQLVPKPNSDFATGSAVLAVTCSAKPADVSSETDIPFDSNNQMVPFHMSIVHWVVAQCWMDDGTEESLRKALFHKSGSMLKPGEYEKQLGRILAEFDVSEAVPTRILWQPEGGRTGSWWLPNKSNPLPW